jgi:hypothetical protein
MTIQPRCIGTNKSGEQCRGKALSNSRYCIAHDPARVVDMAEWRRQGGKAKSNKARARKQLPDAALSPMELQGVLSVTLKGLLAGRIEPGVANAAASLGRALVVIRDATILEERVAQLEEQRRVGR